MANIGSYPLNEIITGDSRLLAQSIPDESIDLIFTDPVYENIDDYRWLAETAERILKPNSACLVWIGTDQADKVMEAMNKNLDFAWTLHTQKNGAPRHGRTGITIITQCLWFEKGKTKIYQKSADWYREGKNGLPDTYSGFEWSKAADTLAKWLSVFSEPNQLIYDPFTGTGSLPCVCRMLERDFIASEINPERAEHARNRLLQTQPPLGWAKPNTASSGRLDSSAQSELFITDGVLPSKARGATRRR